MQILHVAALGDADAVSPACVRFGVDACATLLQHVEDQLKLQSTFEELSFLVPAWQQASLHDDGPVDASVVDALLSPVSLRGSMANSSASLVPFLLQALGGLLRLAQAAWYAARLHAVCVQL
jgi:hypothetical protein